MLRKWIARRFEALSERFWWLHDTSRWWAVWSADVATWVTHRDRWARIRGKR